MMDFGSAQKCGCVPTQECVQHRGVIGVQNPAIDAGNMDHRLYWFGDVPGSFEHVQKSKHLRRSGQCEMKVSALTVIGLRVVVAQRDLQTGVHLDGVFVILFGCLLDGDGQCS